jgi:hypothetical protein
MMPANHLQSWRAESAQIARQVLAPATKTSRDRVLRQTDAAPATNSRHVKQQVLMQAF